MLIAAALPADPELPSLWPTYAALAPHALAVLAPASSDLLAVAEYFGSAGSHAVARDACQLITEAQLGPDHPGTLDARDSLAYWSGQAGDLAVARDQFAALLPACQRILGPAHPATLTARLNLARWTGEAGDPAAARDQLAALLPAYERVVGPDHPDAQSARRALVHWSSVADAAGEG